MEGVTIASETGTAAAIDVRPVIEWIISGEDASRARLFVARLCRRLYAAGVRVYGVGPRSRCQVWVRVRTLKPESRPANYFLDPYPIRIRRVSKNKTQTLIKETGPIGSWIHDYSYL